MCTGQYKKNLLSSSSRCDVRFTSSVALLAHAAKSGAHPPWRLWLTLRYLGHTLRGASVSLAVHCSRSESSAPTGGNPASKFSQRPRSFTAASPLTTRAHDRAPDSHLSAVLPVAPLPIFTESLAVSTVFSRVFTRRKRRGVLPPGESSERERKSLERSFYVPHARSRTPLPT